jgi:hypothetical protein
VVRSFSKQIFSTALRSQYGVASPLNKHFVLAALSFFSVFTLTRIVNMPLMMYAAFTTHRKDIEHFGYAKWTLLGVQVSACAPYSGWAPPCLHDVRSLSWMCYVSSGASTLVVL